MDMHLLTQEELKSKDALTPGLNRVTQQIVNAIPFTTVDPRMKAVIAVSQIMAFASQFNRKILLWDDTLVPINAISFIITGSGNGKDSSVKAARKCFKDGYTKIIKHVERNEKAKAEELAIEKGETNPKKAAAEYMKPIPPVDLMITTEAGLIEHINNIGELGMLSGFLYTGEFSDELAYNPDMVSNIKVLSEIYDTGDKEAKYTKGAEFRSSAIRSQAVNALFVGSPGHILFDLATRKKFDIAFMSKLARRSWFCYTPEKLPEPDFKSIAEMLEYEEKIDEEALKARANMAAEIQDITEFGLDTNNLDIEVSKEVKELFKVYKRYNSEVVNQLPSSDTTYALIRSHLQWKAIKLAGAYALFDKSNIITAKHYIEAIKFCELLDKDMELFEHDLNKSQHEKFADYMRTLLDNEGKATISIHDIKKLGYLQTVSLVKLQELITLCSGYDTNGIFKIDNEGNSITYESIVKTNVLGVSYKPIDDNLLIKLDAAVASGDSAAISNIKHTIAIGASYGFENDDTDFAELKDMLDRGFVFSPFKFRNGTRSKDNVVGGAKWMVFDIDHTTISASEMHYMLGDIRHYVTLTSDASNEYKYRILIELDSVVELDPVTWKMFYKIVSDELALKADQLPQSQVFFSYGGNRPILSNLDADPLPVRKFLLLANEKVANKTVKRAFSSGHNKALLDDMYTTFVFAFEAKNGEGSRQVIRAMLYALDLGADLDYGLQLFNEIQEFWEYPFPADRKELMINQITRIFS